MSALSIQAFYAKELSTSPKPTPTEKRLTKDDGFTKAEAEVGYNPLGRPWDPSEEYQEVYIAHIQPGPSRIRFTGRIVNYAPAFLDSKNMYNRPAHQLIVTDNTGAIAVKLVPIGISASLLVIGQLVTIWATWAGTAANSSHGSIPFVTTYTPINPADVGTKQFIQFLPHTPQNERRCRMPLEYDYNGQKPEPLPGLMTLAQYLKTGHDTRGARIVVCVKSIGSRRRIIMQNRTREAELVEVTVWDDTATCVLTLWEDKTNSAKLWNTNKTILLLTSPKYVASRDGTIAPSNAGISLGYDTLVDVDPDFQEANWLRQWVKDRVKTESVYIPFPKNVWDVEEAVNGPVRPLFTLAEVDDFARTDPATDFTGKLNLTILRIDLVGLYRRKMLCCTMCCGVPLYANNPFATCKNCLKKQSLVLNPRSMGILADETGCIAQGKLLWSDLAWCGLYFPSAESNNTPTLTPELVTADEAEAHNPPSRPAASWVKLTAMDTNGLRTLEEKMMYARFTLTFGWSPFVERLCVLGVEW